jgi:hypothetical protein
MGSLIDQVREAHREQLARSRTLDRAIPGYDGLLVARYGPLPWEELQALLDRLERSGQDYDEELKANIDGLIRACDRIMVRQDDGELVSLADQLREQGEEVRTESGEIRFDHKLVEVLELDVPSDADARQVVLAAFAGAVSPENAVTQHATAIGIWMSGASREVGVSLGEASAARNGSSSQPAPSPSA